MLGWPRRCKLAHASLLEYSDKRLKLAQLLGSLCARHRLRVARQRRPVPVGAVLCHRRFHHFERDFADSNVAIQHVDGAAAKPAKKVLGWPKGCELARAFGWEYG